MFFHTWRVEERDVHLLMEFSVRCSASQQNQLGIFPLYFIMKNFKYCITTKLTEFNTEQSYTHYLDSTINLG